MAPKQTWRKTTLGEILTLEYGYPLPKDVRATGKYPVFGSNGQVGSHAEAKVEGPGIIVGRKGSIGKLAWSESNFWPIDTTYFVKTQEDIKYVYYLLSCLGLEKLNRSTGVPGLNRDDVYAISITLPPLVEQRHIAQTLVTVDEAINANEKIISASAHLKEILARKIFSNESKSWKTVKLGDFATISTGSTPSTSRPNFFIGKNAYIKTTEIWGNKISKSSSFVSDTALTECRLKVHKPGTVLLAMYGQGKTRGNASLLMIPASISQNAAAISVHDGLEPKYLWQYLRSRYEFLRGEGVHGHIAHLNLGFVKELEVPLPPFKEQREIALVLEAIDEKIEINKMILRSREELKNGLANALISMKGIA